MARRSVDTEQAKLASIVLDCMTCMCEMVLLNRLPEFDLDKLGSSHTTVESRIQMKSRRIPELRRVMRRTWGRRVHSPCTLEVLLATPLPGGEWKETLVERLVLAYSAVAVTAQGADGAGSSSIIPSRVDKRGTYQRCAGLVKAVHSAALAVPGQAAARVLAGGARAAAQGSGGKGGTAVDPSSLSLPHLRFRVLVSHPTAPSKHAAHFAKDSPTSTLSLPDLTTPFGALSTSYTYMASTATLAGEALAAASSPSPAMTESAALGPTPHSNARPVGSTPARPLSTLLIHDYAGGGRTPPEPVPPAPVVAPPPAPPAHVSIADVAGAVLEGSVYGGGTEPMPITAATFTPQLGPTVPGMSPALPGATPLSLPEGMADFALDGGMALDEAQLHPTPQGVVLHSLAAGATRGTPTDLSPLLQGRGAGTPQSTSTRSSADTPPASLTTPQLGSQGSAVRTPLLTPGAEIGVGSLPPPLPGGGMHCPAPFAALQAPRRPPAAARGATAMELMVAKRTAGGGERSKAHSAGKALIALAAAATPSPPQHRLSQSSVLEPITETVGGSSPDSPRPPPKQRGRGSSWAPPPFAVLAAPATGAGPAALGTLLLQCEAALHSAPSVVRSEEGGGWVPTTQQQVASLLGVARS